jgi:hypothetical protein
MIGSRGSPIDSRQLATVIQGVASCNLRLVTSCLRPQADEIEEERMCAICMSYDPVPSRCALCLRRGVCTVKVARVYDSFATDRRRDPSVTRVIVVSHLSSSSILVGSMRMER